jgi:hypothetical protein
MEQRLRFLENRILRNIFGPEWDEVNRERRRLYNEEIYYCMAFMYTMDQNVLKIRMLYRNIFTLTQNWKHICKGNHIFMQNCPKCKRFTKIRYT